MRDSLKDQPEGEDITPREASPADPSDIDLVALVCRGDESAFEMLFERHRRRVGVIAGRFFQQPDQIEEIVQQCFVKAYFALPGFSDQGGESLAPWLAKIAFNSCYDELRRVGRRHERMASDLSEQEALAVKTLVGNSSEESIEAATISRDLANKLLTSLVPEDRIILVLLEVEGFTVAEIARMMAWSPAKVKIRAFRARTHLRGILRRFL